MRKLGQILFFLCCLATCTFFGQTKQAVDTIGKELKWKPLKNGLWKNKNGEIGFLTLRAYGSEGSKGTSVVFATHFGFEEQKTLANTIDIASFKQVNRFFYKDKNHVYWYFDMAHGGYFYLLEEADAKTFKAVNGCYAKDKKYVYHEREGKMENADVKTFRAIKKPEGDCYAKDKRGEFDGGSRVGTR